MERRISPGTTGWLLQLPVTFKQVNNHLTSSNSQSSDRSRWLLPPPPPASSSSCFSCCAVAFLAFCIMYIPHLSDMCLLLPPPCTLGGVLMCLPRSLAGCLGSFGERSRAQCVVCQIRLHICSNKWSQILWHDCFWLNCYELIMSMNMLSSSWHHGFTTDKKHCDSTWIIKCYDRGAVTYVKLNDSLHILIWKLETDF